MLQINNMPKKKRGKDGGSPDFVFDYRYTPKPYFTAPVPSVNGSTSLDTNLSSRQASLRGKYNPPSTNLNGFTSHASIDGQSIDKRNISYSSVARGFSSLQKSVSETDDSTAIHENDIGENKKLTMKRTFMEIFKGRVEASVIEMVLQEENWNGMFSAHSRLYMLLYCTCAHCLLNII